MFANTTGSWLWASQLSDERHLAQFEQLLAAAERDKRPHRPALAGYNDLLCAINGLRNDLRQHLRMPRLPGPITPAEIIGDRRKAVSNARLDELGLN